MLFTVGVTTVWTSSQSESLYVVVPLSMGTNKETSVSSPIDVRSVDDRLAGDVTLWSVR